MRIECLTTFLEGARRFEKGDVCTVDDALGHKFVALGWAVAPGEAPAAVASQPAASLSIDNAVHAAGDSNG